jgi:hypothetical protein
MAKIDDDILNISQAISKNIGKFDASERGLLSQNILNTLRHFVEHICLKEYAQGQELETSYDNLKLAVKKLQPKSRLGYLRKFHNSLQGMVSHYMSNEENSERLMLKYYEYLLRIKIDLKKYYGLEVLENLSKFPINTDRSLQDYYEKIVEQMTNPKSVRQVSTYNDRYYIQKIKPFFVNEKIYYEVTFTVANSEVSKFDRVIAFTELDITQNYSVVLTVIHDKINVLGKGNAYSNH